MNCANSNCTITGNDRMVSCWLCLNFYHLKCCGLKPRDADALSDDSKSLHWTCPDCKNIGIEFYNMFRSSKDEFNKIKNEFLVLQQKFNEFSNIFIKYPNLEKFTGCINQSVSPKRKKTQSSPHVALNSQLSLPKNNKTTNLNTENVFQDCSVTPVSNMSLPIYSSDRISPLSTNKLATNHTNNAASCSRSSTSTGETDNISNGNSTVGNGIIHPLKVIPPKKSIFISRLADETSAADIEFYIKHKLGGDLDIMVRKFKFSRPRSIASFKLMVPQEVFDRIINTNFWPPYVFIREFINNDDRKIPRIAHLPLAASKN